MSVSAVVHVSYLAIVTCLKFILPRGPLLFQPLLTLLQQEAHQPLIGCQWH